MFAEQARLDFVADDEHRALPRRGRLPRLAFSLTRRPNSLNTSVATRSRWPCEPRSSANAASAPPSLLEPGPHVLRPGRSACPKPSSAT